MARYLKRDAHAQQLRNYVLFAFAVAIIAAMVLGFVTQRRTHTRLGTQKRELEMRVGELRRLTNNHAILLAQRSSPLELIRRAESAGLTKIAMSQRLFVPLPETPASVLALPAATSPVRPAGQFATAAPH